MVIIDWFNFRADLLEFVNLFISMLHVTPETLFQPPFAIGGRSCARREHKHLHGPQPS